MTPKHKGLTSLKITNADKGEFEAVFATLGVKDLDGDVTVKGAFNNGEEVRISAYNHKSWEGALPVGKGVISEQGNLVICKGQFFLDTTAGADTFAVVKQMGDLQEWSYGYDTLEEEFGTLNGEPVNFLKKLLVHEVSPVILGAGIETQTLAVKSRGKSESMKQLYSEVWNALREAGRERWAAVSTSYVYVYDFDIDADWAIFSVCQAGQDDRMIRMSYVRQSDGSVELTGDEVAVEMETNFVPAKGGDGPSGTKGAVPYKKTATDSGTWDGPGTKAEIPNDCGAAMMKQWFAWVDPEGDPDKKGSYKFIHHDCVDGKPGAANLKACSAGIAVLNGGRGGTTIPDADRQAVYNHLAKHLEDAGKEPPELKAAPDSPGLKFSEHIDAVLSEVDELSERAASVVTLRTEQGKSKPMGDEAQAGLKALTSRLETLKGLLEKCNHDDLSEVDRAFLSEIARSLD